jgi:hypothetical protein
MANKSLRYERGFGDFNQAWKKKQSNGSLLPSAARYCATLASLCMKAHFFTFHRTNPLHRCTDLKKLFLPSENTQRTPEHQTLEAHVTSMLSQMRNLQPLVPSPRGCRIVA